MLLPSISTPNVWFFMFSIWILVASFMVLISFALWLVVFPFGECIFALNRQNSKLISNHNVHKHSGQKSRILCRKMRLIITHFRVKMATMGEGLAYYSASIWRKQALMLLMPSSESLSGRYLPQIRFPG